MKFNNILVTGATGFVGSHLVEELVKQKAQVIATTHHPVLKNSYFATQKLDKKTEVVKIDLIDYSKVQRLIAKVQPQYIFHLAAQPLVDVAYDDPKETLYSNILGTVNVLESARRYGKVKAIVVASSDKAYGKITSNMDEKAKPKYLESDPLVGDHPYEVSKSATDLIAQSYFRTYSLPVVITRFGNIYGEGDLHFSRLIPGIMKAMARDEVFEIRSNGKYVRDYLYVKDVVSGYLSLANNIERVKGEAFNFGSDDTYSVLDLIKLISQICQIPLKYKILDTAQNEIPYQSLDWSKIKKTLNWKPEHYLSSTINLIYDWYKSSL